MQLQMRDQICIIWQNNMDHLILLGGNHVGNKKWVESVERLLKPHFSSTNILYYRHWTTGAEWIDIDYELEQLVNLVKKRKSYIILSRSAGTILTLKGIFEKRIHPKNCIYIAIAIKWAQNYNVPVKKWLSHYSIPSLLIQKSHDPAISFKDLQQFLIDNKAKNYQLIEIPGDDHYYGNIEEIKNLVLNYYK